jgi:serine phosphatase RsbU (regulator of sigma subunit)
MTCPDCAAELDHCHGVLVLHSDGIVECTDPDCVDLGRDRHALGVQTSSARAVGSPAGPQSGRGARAAAHTHTGST